MNTNEKLLAEMAANGWNYNLNKNAFYKLITEPSDNDTSHILSDIVLNLPENPDTAYFEIKYDNRYFATLNEVESSRCLSERAFVDYMTYEADEKYADGSPLKSIYINSNLSLRANKKLAEKLDEAGAKYKREEIDFDQFLDVFREYVEAGGYKLYTYCFNSDYKFNQFIVITKEKYIQDIKYCFDDIYEYSTADFVDAVIYEYDYDEALELYELCSKNNNLNFNKLIDTYNLEFYDACSGFYDEKSAEAWAKDFGYIE